jgi:hypothetical protein
MLACIASDRFEILKDAVTLAAAKSWSRRDACPGTCNRTAAPNSVFDPRPTRRPYTTSKSVRELPALNRGGSANEADPDVYSSVKSRRQPFLRSKSNFAGV